MYTYIMDYTLPDLTW